MNDAIGKLVREANSCVSWPYNTTSVDLTPLTPNAHRPTFDQPPPQPPAATCSGSPLSHPRCCAVLHLHGAHTCLWGSLTLLEARTARARSNRAPPHRARPYRAPPHRVHRTGPARTGPHHHPEGLSKAVIVMKRSATPNSRALA